MTALYSFIALSCFVALAVVAPGVIRAHRRARRWQNLTNAFVCLGIAGSVTAKQINEFSAAFVWVGETLTVHELPPVNNEVTG